MNKNIFINKLKIFFFFILSILIIIYTFYKISDYFIGPKLTIISPIDGQTVNEETFFVKGNIKNVKEIKLNGREINIDEKGNFKEELITHSPITIIVINATDRYGKTLEKILKVVKLNK